MAGQVRRAGPRPPPKKFENFLEKGLEKIGGGSIMIVEVIVVLFFFY
jgi:hypothetical protein